MKKLVKSGIAAVCFASLLSLTACGSAPVAISYNANWHANTSIQTITAVNEKLTYKVTFTEGKNEYYSVKYDEGTYTTSLVNASIGGEYYYKLSTRLDISGNYSFGSESKAFTDYVTSEVYFRSVGDSLLPVKSQKTIHSTSPIADGSKAKAISDVVKEFDQTIVCEYNATNTKATVNGEEFAVTSSTLDNEQFLFALRGLSLPLSANLPVFNAANNATETIYINSGASSLESAKLKIVDNGDTEVQEYKNIATNSVVFYRNSNMSGVAQRAIYAAPVSGYNTYRNVMFVLEVPMAYNLGTLAYTLTEADFINN